MERDSYIPDYIPGSDALPLSPKEVYDILDGFFEWFSQSEGFGYREERFWNAIEYQDDKEAYRFLRTAWVLGYKAGQASVPKDNLQVPFHWGLTWLERPGQSPFLMARWVINHIPAKEQEHFSDDIKTAYVVAPDLEGAWDVFLSVYKRRLILSTYEDDGTRFTPGGRLL